MPEQETNQSSESTEQNNQVEQNNQTDNSAGVFTLPEQYRDKPYLKDIDSYDKALKLLDDSQTLIGKKRTIMPDETSTPDDIAEFNKLRGVPDDHNTYVSVNTKEGADTTFFDAMKPAFKKANMTAKDVAILEAEIAPVLEKITGTKVEADKAQGEAFDALTEKIFAGTKETDLAQAKILMDAHTPEGLKKHMNELSNEHLAIMACVMKGVRAKYMREDTTDNGGGGDAGSAEDIRTEGKKQIAIAQDPKSTMQQKIDAKKKANELYAQYDSMTKK